MKSNKIILVGVAAALLSSCSYLSSEPKLAALKPLTQKAGARTNWAVEVGRGTEKNYLQLEPALDEQYVYVDDYKGDVLSIDKRNGKVRWHTALKNHVTSGVGVGDGVVGVGSQNGFIYGLDKNSGKVLWHARVPGEILATPNVTNNKMFIKTQSGRIYAFNAASGQKLWSYKSSNPNLVLRGSSKIATAKNLAIAGFADGSVIAFEQGTGKEMWHIQLAIPHGVSAIERMVDITADPNVDGDTMYIAAYQGQLAAVKVNNGDIVWQKQLSAYAGLSVGPKAVFVTDADSKVWAFNKKDGLVLWHNDELSGRDVSGPSYNRGRIAVGDKKGYVHWLAAKDGHFLARERAGHASIFASPISKGGYTYFYTSAGQLMSYEMG